MAADPRFVSRPVTADVLVADLRALGLLPGQTVLVHTALSKLGWVIGGEQAVLGALLDVLGANGTLVLPAHSADRTDPATWNAPPVPADWWPAIRAGMPAYDRWRTPTWRIGALPECFRTWPGVRRSEHPTVSFAALGRHADTVLDGHSLDDGLGERSPLARLYDLDAWVLLLGAPHSSNTSLHLAEYRADYPAKDWVRQSSPMLVDGARAWVGFTELDTDTADFDRIGADFAATGAQHTGTVGDGQAALLRQRALVDFGVRWLSANRR